MRERCPLYPQKRTSGAATYSAARVSCTARTAAASRSSRSSRAPPKSPPSSLTRRTAEFVFTYEAQRTIEGRFKGERYPLTVSGVKTNWRRLRKAAGVSDFRFHDFRHDFATKLLRRSRNLKLTQKALNHSDIRTTLKYAHVLDDEVAAAIEDVAQSREKPRGHVRKVS